MLVIQKKPQYSPKNSRVNPNPPYSILYLETNSDSPSNKSKGVRPSSIKHISEKTTKIATLILESKNRPTNIKKHMTTSKEMLINTTRIKETRAKELAELRVTDNKDRPINPRKINKNKKKLEKLMANKAQAKKITPVKRKPRPSDFKNNLPPSTKVCSKP
jgi:ribosomal protein L14E/L6E/L27E